MADAWTLRELVERASRALAAADVRAPNGRVTEVPDARMIRWYATTGLVDRPVVRGRIAYYGRRHLLQVIAVKRLQAQGQTLAEIQQRLTGATEETLRRLAAVPALSPETSIPRPAQEPTEAGLAAERPAQLDRARFWATPAAPSSPPAGPPATPSATTTSMPAAPSPHPAAGDGPLFGLRLDGATLLLESLPADDDMPAIREAAGPLLDLLAARGLISTPTRTADRTERGGPA
jgi:DNA-binding transcriptional MerR regulator